jgi:hypothetical protein
MNSKTRSLTKFTKTLLCAVVILVCSQRASRLVWWPRMESNTIGRVDVSMHPQVLRSGPGQCPICGMDLIPVSQLTAEKDRLAAIGVNRAGHLS